MDPLDDHLTLQDLTNELGDEELIGDLVQGDFGIDLAIDLFGRRDLVEDNNCDVNYIPSYTHFVTFINSISFVQFEMVI